MILSSRSVCSSVTDMTFMLFDHTLVPLQWSAVLGASLYAAYTDLKTRRIPNGITGALFLTGLGFSGWVGGAWGVAEALTAACVLGLPFVILFAFAGGGAGDAKLMGAAGAWLGLFNGVIALVTVVIVGAVFGILVTIRQRQVRSALFNVYMINQALMATILGPRKTGISGDIAPSPEVMHKFPYGISIFLGMFLTAMWFWICKY